MPKKFTLSPITSFRAAPLAVALVLLLSSNAMASGGVDSFGEVPRDTVDEAYEFGKAVYKGRIKGTEKIKYCVRQDDEVKKLKRSTAKKYRKGSTQKFALALIDCKMPERLALTTMPREHIPAVLYYLNKRYKLKLEDS